MLPRDEMNDFGGRLKQRGRRGEKTIGIRASFF
jgi:hypothetical protein